MPTASMHLSGPPDRADVAVLDVAHLRAHVAGGEDVGEEEHLLIGEAAPDADRTHVGERHPGVLGLPAGEATGQV